MNFNLPTFTPVKTWIDTCRRNQKSWDEILNGISFPSLSSFLTQMQALNFWPQMTDAEWKELVGEMKKQEDLLVALAGASVSSIITSVQRDNTLSVPLGEDSSWQTYKRKLEEKGYNPANIEEIQASCLKTLQCLSRETEVDNPRKGLVVGNVQSGKTGHMAGLMAMAADWGWNMFIVFSGTIENLRDQNQRRLIEDLKNQEDRLTWLPLPPPEAHGNIQDGYNLQQLSLSEKSTERYLTVCLKNITRIKYLLDWIHADRNNRQNLRILVIDDEADQASINTNDVENAERTAINNAIINLVSGKTSNGSQTTGFAAMNYVAYTATPYANLLNESSRESLYPKDFITSLKTPKEYFGPQQIFGIPGGDYDGLDIIRQITNDELKEIKELYAIPKGKHDKSLPAELEKAICWFLCGVACVRYFGLVRPISMLVHTSMRTPHHKAISDAIDSWLGQGKDEIIKKCSTVWEDETKEFTIEKFWEQYPDYSRPRNLVSDYPDFSSILPHLSDLLDNGVSQIPIDEDGKPEYKKGIHLCIDNSTATFNAEDEKIRILYPKKEQLKELKFAPAFIVVGGNTLSRGLTIEGLISTYFIRVVNQADTLMQMGRWFGYRGGYELLPRIWMTADTMQKFEYLSKLDYDLRNEIRDMERRGATPNDYAIRLKNSPSYIRITADNRQQRIDTDVNAADMDFSGTLLQTFIFDDNTQTLSENLDRVRSFLSKLGSSDKYNSHAKNSLIWRNVRFDIIKELLEKYSYSEGLKGFNDIKSLLEWIDEVTAKELLGTWNVVLCGKDNQNGNLAQFEVDANHFVTKITRTRKRDINPGIINIGVLTNPSDFIADLDMDRVSEDVKNAIKADTDSREIRSISNLNKCPQLLLYVIDKDSKAKKVGRMDLGTDVDVVGLAINIPGHTDVRNHVTTVRIKLDPNRLINLTNTEE